MKKYIINIKRLSFFALTLTYCLSITSCEKFLDEKSNDSFVVPQTLQDFQAILDNNIVLNQKSTPSLGESCADDYYLRDIDYETFIDRERNFYKWVKHEYNFQNDWSICYQNVYNANICLEGISKIPTTAANSLLWNNVKGSSLFFRAYNFLNLIWVFGKAYDETSSNTDKGIVLRLQSDFTLPSVRANVKDSYEQVIKDAKESILYLPNIPAHVMRPSKTASYGLLARAYLSMRMYDSAHKYSNLSLQASDQLLNFNTDVSINSNVPFTPFNKEIIFYSEINLSWSLIAPAFAKIDTALYDSYDANDLRKIAFFRSSNGRRFKGSYASSISILFSGISTNELFLIRAECAARRGNKEDAVNDLNKLLENRWVTGTYSPITSISFSTEALISLILKERRKELLMRGLRWIDIKRLNKEGYGLAPKRYINGVLFDLPPNSDFYAIPLPTDILRTTGMPDN
ncbi:MAG: RagB/SusD family nutrient uptake outer membrane protein [Chryseobacterium sp.]|nr:MAG: RagB/SusD family nutrient uptake outer membrane protein [Chryseobacterium sp.]